MIAPVLLVARRDYFAYVGSWGFWIGLLTAPVIMAVLLFAPVLLARAEPPGMERHRHQGRHLRREGGHGRSQQPTQRSGELGSPSQLPTPHRQRQRSDQR